MPNETVPEDGYLKQQKYLGLVNGQRLWTNDDGDYFTWDRMHGEIEWYNRNGYHLGVRDSITGDLIKPAKKGRTINVR